MAGSASKFPEIIFLRRSDSTGYGFFYYSESDFTHALDSFVVPILRSFDGEPVPGQPDPRDHLVLAIGTFIGQAFDRRVPPEVGAEGVSRAAAALARQTYPGPMPRVIVVERKDKAISLRAGTEFMRHPGHPLAIVVDGDAHGGEARFFNSAAEFAKVGDSPPDARCWLPQIIHRLYKTTPSVMAGKPSIDSQSGETKVACRGFAFGLKAALVEREAS
jgi:hypothetical protein